ncbi:alpha/beta fold hydrolase [Microvirga makkahensis]|uniref:alpha/beta fold hydrolase n=1 Tax=Microvirga makkahensis TaxID=1128670 RepID=UPI001FED1E1C|nr:alpha/beta hydrolase [Microvirga makkahensis]
MAVRSSDHWIGTASGKLFAKVWAPATQRGTAAIVLLHDSLGCVELWRDFPERLASATRRIVVAYDRLGFGSSDPYPGFLPTSFIRDEATDYIPLLREQLDLGALIPFGHSVGGGMAVATAAHLPDICAALVTESAQAFVEDRTLAGIPIAKAAFQEPGQFERLERYHGDKARWVLDAWTETWLAPSFAHWNLDEALNQVRCPTLALHGDQDEYGSERHPERIARLTPGPADPVILSGCGHVPHREQPERVLREVTLFLKGSFTETGR